MKVMIIAPPELHNNLGRFTRVAEKLEKPLRYLLYSLTFSVCAVTLFGMRWSILTSNKDRDRTRSKENRDRDRYDKVKGHLWTTKRGKKRSRMSRRQSSRACRSADLTIALCEVQ